MGKTTTDPANWDFAFSISDLARLLGKSPVTIRGWERRGEISIDRHPSGGDRRLTTEGIREVAQFAHGRRRISIGRLRLIEATMTLIEQVQRENSR